MSDMFDDDGYDAEDFDVTCKRCGEGGLHWVDYGDGWKLVDEDGVHHVCPRATADDFDVLPDV